MQVYRRALAVYAIGCSTASAQPFTQGAVRYFWNFQKFFGCHQRHKPPLLRF